MTAAGDNLHVLRQAREAAREYEPPAGGPPEEPPADVEIELEAWHWLPEDFSVVPLGVQGTRRDEPDRNCR